MMEILGWTVVIAAAAMFLIVSLFGYFLGSIFNVPMFIRGGHICITVTIGLIAVAVYHFPAHF